MITFVEYLEMTGFQSYQPLGTVIPNSFTGGMVPGNWTGNTDTYKDLTHGQSYIQNNALQKEPNAGFDLPLPKTVKKAKIYQVHEKGNPVIVNFTDGTTIYLPINVYRKQKDKLVPGKEITVAFQRRQSDMSNEPSKISYMNFN